MAVCQREMADKAAFDAAATTNKHAARSLRVLETTHQDLQVRLIMRIREDITVSGQAYANQLNDERDFFKRLQQEERAIGRALHPATARVSCSSLYCSPDRSPTPAARTAWRRRCCNRCFFFVVT